MVCCSFLTINSKLCRTINSKLLLPMNSKLVLTTYSKLLLPMNSKLVLTTYSKLLLPMNSMEEVVYCKKLEEIVNRLASRLTRLYYSVGWLTLNSHTELLIWKNPPHIFGTVHYHFREIKIRIS